VKSNFDRFKRWLWTRLVGDKRLWLDPQPQAIGINRKINKRYSITLILKIKKLNWPNLAEWGLCTPIGMPTNGHHGDTDEMLRRQPPAYSVQPSCTDILLSCHTHGLTL